jgi:hypothetical protein
MASEHKRIRQVKAEMVRRGWDKNPKTMHFDHTDANGVVYRVTGSCTQPKRGQHYLAPTGVKGTWEVRQAACDFAKHHYIIVEIVEKP